MAKTSKKKETTIDDLRKFTAEQFVTTHAEIDRVDKKVDALDVSIQAGFQEMRVMKRDILIAVQAIRDVRIDDLQKEVKKLKQHVGLK